MIPKWELGVGGFSSIIFNLDYATKVSVSMPVLIYHKKFGTDVFVLGNFSPKRTQGILKVGKKG